MNKCRKNNNRFKIFKFKKLKKKKENSKELQKPNVEAEVYNNSKKCNWGNKTKLKSLIGFHSAKKINNYNRGGGKWKKNPKASTEQVKKWE